jgi:hypothetical protein
MSYILSVEPYLNQYQKQYQNILAINNMPSGPLAERIVHINPPKLSPFTDFNTHRCNQCIYAIRHDCPSAHNEYATLEDVPDTLNYLVSNGYKIDHDTTRLLQKTPMAKRIICVFTTTTI